MSVTTRKSDAQRTMEASKKLADENSRTREAAREFLVKLGTHRKSGGLTSKYGR
jgi:hypothetical protein